MRFSELFGPAAAEFAAIILSFSLPAVQAVNFNPVSSPNLDLSALGRVALTGNFDSISVYSYQDQNERPFTTNGSQSLLTQMPNGVFASLVASDAAVLSMCPFVRQNGDMAGIIIGGNFTSLGGTPTQGVALWDPSNNNITPLPGLNGSVSAVYCNQDTDTVYVGGDFHGGNSTNAIAWVGMAGWANMPFAGFNGPVSSILKAPNGNILFGGSFTGLGNTTTPTDQDAQVINLSSANISAGPGSTQAGLTDPKNIVCKTGGQDGAGNTWLTADGGGGFWRADLNFGFQPTKLRIWNTHFQGRGSKTFRFTAFPINGIMNLTYADPVTKKEATCDATCPLSNDSSIPYQDFKFVNVIGMDSFQIDISDFYGAGAGLDGIELFQDDIYAYAVPSLNEPACSGAQFPSSATFTGPWKVTPSGLSGAEYLTAQLGGPGVNSNSAEVTFLPDIKQSGNYTVTIYTPGCQQDNSCGSRGIANVTGSFTPGGQQAAQQIFQTNDFDKYDQIYHGYVDKNSASFRPTITLTPLSNQQDSINLVALRVRFQLQSASSSGLNGLFEYDTNMASVSTNFAADTYDAAGKGLSQGAQVNSIAVIGQSTYIAGNFTTSNYSNIFQMDAGQPSSLPNAGLNNAVGTTLAWGNLLFVGGNFTDTATASNQNLKSVAVYDSAARSWGALGGGVNGPVNNIVPLLLNITENVPETCITVNGQFNQVLASGSNPPFSVNGGLAIYVPSHGEWLHNLNIQTESIQGQLTAATNVSGSSPLLAGTIASQGWALSDSVSMSTGNGNVDIAPIGLKVQPGTAPSALQARDTIAQTVTGAITGLFDTDNGRNITVLAGNFRATASGGSTITNLAIISTNGDGSQNVTGLLPGVDSNSTFRAVSRNGDTLAAGGQITGNVSGGSTDGLVLWDLASSSYVSPQPPALTGKEVAVYAISTRPSSSDLYVGGNFDAGGQLPCPSLCYYTGGQWNRPGNGIGGTIGSMLWQGGSQLLVAGNLTVSDNVTYVAQYNSDSQTWTIPNGAALVPGPVTALTQASSDGSSYWIAGSSTKNGTAYLVKYDGTNFNAVPQIFGDSTIVRGLSVVSLSQNHNDNSLIDNSLALMITGQINVPNFGNASAVLFNGTTLTPLILSNSGNEPGILSQVITESLQSFSSEASGLKIGYVVAIALAIALGVMMLLVAIGLLVERRRRKAEGYRPAPQNYFEKTANMGRIPPERLFSSLNQPSAPRV